MDVTQIKAASEIDFAFPADLSFFAPYLPLNIKETLEVGGEAHIAKTQDDIVSGVFIFDNFEKVGTIYTRSRQVFDFFYGLKQFNYLFSELETELEKEIYDVYTKDMAHFSLGHGFTYEISHMDRGNISGVEQFMLQTHRGINPRWVSVAFKNGERCLTVRLSDEIVGVGWVSLVNGIGRLHSLYVKPQYRRMGMGEDILNARLFWLKANQACSVFTEVSRLNVPSANNILKAGLKVSGQVFQYFKKRK
jgi:ribosomal protein S18 acetylase RimI-like enzyme